MSIAEVAKLAGVSNTTVSFVINNKPGISKNTAKKVKSAMRKIGYIPRSCNSKDTLKREFTGLRYGNIGVAMGEFVMSTVPFYARLFEAIHNTLDIRGLKMIPMRLDGNASLNSQSLSDIDAVISCYYFKNMVNRFPLPFVSILGHPDVNDKLNADHIEPANDRIGVIAANYFIDRGHKNILAINPSIDRHPAFDTRLSFLKKTAEKSDIKASIKKLPFSERDNQGRLVDGENIQSIKYFIEEYKSMTDRPTAIFVPCDSHLAVLQKSFYSAGITPGSDLEFLGCNNEAILLDGLDVRPATIDINPAEIAKAAVNVLLLRVEEPDCEDKIFQLVSIEPSLVEPGSKVKQHW